MSAQRLLRRGAAPPATPPPPRAQHRAAAAAAPRAAAEPPRCSASLAPRLSVAAEPQRCCASLAPRHAAARQRRQCCAPARAAPDAAPPLDAAPRYTSRDRFWHWPGHGQVHYQTAGHSGPPLLLLPGFGVGTFHFRAQLDALSGTHRVYALDFLGQGDSWPEDATGLQFSATLWARQVADFIEHVIGEPTFLAGNSLGGFVAAYVGATHPARVLGVALLNATPFWSNAPNPERDPAGAARMPWDGTLPAPWPFVTLVSLWWNTLRNPKTVRALLGLVYTDAAALDDALVEAILAPTRRHQAREVFVSIFLSPAAPLRFDEMLEALRCPVCLIYGRDDPWVVPLWGQRAMRRLRADTAYYELAPAGHCPHHERPEAVNALLQGWLAARVAGTPEPLPAHGDALEFPLRGGGVLRAERTDGAPRNAFEIADAAAAAASADGRTKSAPGMAAALQKLLPPKR